MFESSERNFFEIYTRISLKNKKRRGKCIIMNNNKANLHFERSSDVRERDTI